MDVAAGERKPRTDGKLMGGAGGPAQNHLGGKNIAGKAGQRGDLYSHEFTESAADVEMMGGDMEPDVFHAARLGAAAGTAMTTNRLD